MEASLARGKRKKNRDISAVEHMLYQKRQLLEDQIQYEKAETKARKQELELARRKQELNKQIYIEHNDGHQSITCD